MHSDHQVTAAEESSKNKETIVDAAAGKEAVGKALKVLKDSKAGGAAALVMLLSVAYVSIPSVPTDLRLKLKPYFIGMLVLQLFLTIGRFWIKELERGRQEAEARKAAEAARWEAEEAKARSEGKQTSSAYFMNTMTVKVKNGSIIK